MTPEQVAKDRDEQPEPDNEHEYREGVGWEIAESEAFDTRPIMAGRSV